MCRVITFALLVVTLGLTVVCEAQTVILHVVDRGEMDASVPGAGVRASDSTGKQIYEGITNNSGEVTFRGRVNQPVPVQYEKVGYIRRPETTTLTGRTGNNKITRPLIRTGADGSYHARLGSHIKDLVQAAPAADRERIANEELGRVRALSEAAQATVVASFERSPSTVATAGSDRRALPATASSRPLVLLAGTLLLVVALVLTTWRLVTGVRR